jgi:hypothetical protein
MSRRLIALVGAAALVAALAGQVSAKVPPGHVTVDTDGCSFTVHIAFDQPWPVITWKVKVYDATNWKDGKTLIKDSATNDADGKIDAGPYTLPAGHYNVAVDNEESVDGSSYVVEFTLACGGSESPGNGSESPSGSELPAEGSQPPTGSELPAEGSQPPTGSELPAEGSQPPSQPGGDTTGPTGEVEGISATPPPTDAASASTADAGTGLPLVAISILAIASTLAWFTRRTLATARASRRR